MMLVAQNIAKYFTLGGSRVEVLQNASLELAAGERLAITGRSGAGKSTLLHILGGLSEPSKGSLSVFGENVYLRNDADRARIRSLQLGMVFQAYHLLPDLTVVENVVLPAMNTPAFRRDPRGIAMRARNLIEKVGLGHRLEHRPNELSGGEQQRVALARAMINDPRILLADEPTGNLDDSTGADMLELLFGFAADQDRGLIVVTHSTALAESCDRWLMIENGMLREQT